MCMQVNISSTTELVLQLYLHVCMVTVANICRKGALHTQLRWLHKARKIKNAKGLD